MKWFWNGCRRRSDAALLAAGAVHGEERRELETHLAECDECRTYFDEIKTATSRLVGWEKSLSAIEATPAVRSRWAKAVTEAAAAAPAAPGRSGSEVRFWSMVWRQLIWPSRYAWGGLAALWAAMLLVNAQISDHSIRRNSSSPQQIIQAWEEQNRDFAEWTRPAIIPAAPAQIPRPRSQRDQNWAAT